MPVEAWDVVLEVHDAQGHFLVEVHRAIGVPQGAKGLDEVFPGRRQLRVGDGMAADGADPAGVVGHDQHAWIGGRLDLDHIGPEVGQGLSCKGPSNELTQLNHAQTV